MKALTARDLEGGWVRECKEDDKNKCLRKGNQLNSKIDTIRFKGKEKMGEMLEI